MKQITLLLLALTLIILTACQSRPTEISGENIDTAGGSYKNVSVNELATMLKNKDFVFVNVHIPFEGDIAATDLSVSYDQIAQNLSQLPSDKNAKIVLYCRSGRMSEIAAEELVSLGYTNIWNLEGGMVQWEQAGFDLEK
ncbi:MAG TPA: rhodanese-like domain-containing protein [Anaerolineales bacterium]|nr:rhodanese-like domain-containing protein [Anaerolineales bacterium]